MLSSLEMNMKEVLVPRLKQMKVCKHGVKLDGPIDREDNKATWCLGCFPWCQYPKDRPVFPPDSDGGARAT